MPSTTVTSKGQVTIPKRIREFLRVKSGDRIDFDIDARGAVVVRPAGTDLKALKGLLRRSGRRPVTIARMDAAIAKHHRRPR
jgi:AbrB family looped-hinge helix DNA binding protein